MFFIGEHRKTYLEFLRNLTPQVAFLTLTLIFGSKIALSWNGLGCAIVCAGFLFVFLEATIANLGLFIETFVTSTLTFNEKEEEIKRANVKKLTWWIQALWHHNRAAVFKLLFVLVICELACIAVCLAALQAASASSLLSHG